MKTSTKTFLWIAGCSIAVVAALFVALNYQEISNSIKERRLRRQIMHQTEKVQFDSTKIDNIHNIILMDESGSMSSMREEAVSGAQETVLSIKAARDTVPELKQFVTVASFCGDQHLDLRYSVKAKAVEEVKTDFEEYRPHSCTPLYDAIGSVIQDYIEKVNENDYVMMTIITDGYENASHQYTAASIKTIIDSLSAKNWTFTYIGTNQDAMLEGGRIGIQNSYNYDNTKQGYRDMIQSESYRRNTRISRIGADKRR